MGKRKTIKEKMDTGKEPEVKRDPKGRGMMLIATPRIVESYIKKIKKGKLATVEQLRRKMAEDYGADFSCPLATGWFIRIVAEYAEWERGEGKKNIAPYWRLIKEKGKLNDKYPGGAERHAQLLKDEGFEIVSVRGKPVVKDYEKHLINW
ncbi:methylated DNA-protein cysteine methyltransferase [bacterium]|nr:MAG: methylated DNA-protein cysteine methyltransferase [bacterium]